MKVALDTNLLAYVEGVNGPERQATAIDLIDRLPRAEVVIPVQVLGELYNVLVRKGGWLANRARAAILAWRTSFPLAPTTEAALLAALELAGDHKLAIWDSLILAVGAENDCRVMLSEDLQDGFSWQGLTAVNPFAPTLHPLLEALITAGEGEGERGC